MAASMGVGVAGTVDSVLYHDVLAMMAHSFRDELFKDKGPPEKMDVADWLNWRTFGEDDPILERRLYDAATEIRWQRHLFYGCMMLWVDVIVDWARDPLPADGVTSEPSKGQGTPNPQENNHG